jgi:hypothetical protein
LSSILFMPIVFSLSLIFVCTYDSNDCQNVPIRMVLKILTIICFPGFLGFTFLMGMTYFHPNPESTSFGARPNARQEILELLTKTILPFFFTFAKSNPILRAAAVFCCILPNIIYFWYYLP